MKTVWIIILIIVLAGGAFFFMSSGGDKNDAMMSGGEEVMEVDESMGGAEVMEKEVMKGEGNMEEGGEEMMVKAGSYENYSAEKVSQAEGKVVLFFHATWCPYCRALDGELKKELSKIPQGLTILKTDYDSEVALKQKYGVTYQHTLVQVDAQGNMITKWSGSENLSQILANIK